MAKAGRKPDVRQRFNRMFREMLEPDMPELIRILIDRSKDGDMVALRMLMDRALPIQDFKTAELEREVNYLRELLEEVRARRIAA